MNVEELKREHIQVGSNVLVLSPLTPGGTGAYTELLSTTDPSKTNMAVVTYTQPPSMWLTDWEATNAEAPKSITFIHNGSEPGEEITADRAQSTTVETVRTSPQDPIDVVTHLGDELKRWDAEADQSVISVQTLTILLEYLDFETAFRYLHVLIHRVQAAGAIGFYQMDPTIHDEETINTLSVLFDAVVEVGQTETGDADWELVSSKTRADAATNDRRAGPRGGSGSDTEFESGPSPNGDGYDQPRDRSLLTEFKSWIGSLWFTNGIDGSRRRDRHRDGSVAGPGEVSTSPSPRTDQSERTAMTDGSTGTREDPQAGNGSMAAPNPDAGADEPLLTDREQIQQLLSQSGGRMRQSDLVDETRWSSSSVSRKLSGMESDGLVTRVQVGRGNLVFLAGYEPDAATSALDGPDEQATVTES